MIAYLRPQNPSFRCVDGEWRSDETVELMIDTAEYGKRALVIPQGTPTDFLTLPWWARPLRLFFPQCGRSTIPSFAHDDIYTRRIFDRRTCDLIYLRLNVRYGVKPWRYWAKHVGLRLFGWYWYYFKK